MTGPEKTGGIVVLPRELQNQIAAGEVVERPASVLKELVENSLDAGADRVEAVIEAGGQGLISVQDNGTGLAQQELAPALTRHATSKIESVEDLLHLASFGFRGEALPSIASVSRFRIASVPRDGSEGSSLEVELGTFSQPRPAPVREGTRVEVRDLFLNTPARLKFLKKQSTEAKKCQEVLQRLALVNPHSAFSLISNGRQVLDFERNQGLLQRLEAIWPEQITSSLLPVHWEEEGYSVTGYAGHPDTAQGRAERILFFVNRRPVQGKLLHSALKQAYTGRLLSREYPQAVLFLELPPSQVDINVHPAKSEVKFREEKTVYSLLVNAVRNALDRREDGGSGLRERMAETRSQEPLAEGQKTGPPRQGLELRSREPDARFWESTNAYQEPGTTDQAPEPSPASRLPTSETGAELGPDLAYLGQFQSTYLILRLEGKLLFVDQHAAHERVLYTSYEQGSRTRRMQRLALPLRLRLHASEKAALDHALRSLRDLGFALQREDEENIAIQGIPEYLDRSRARDFLRDVLREGGQSMEQLWSLLACRNAVKAGEPLSLSEAVELLRAWLDCPRRQHCPHGRPVSAELTSRDLEKMFKRGK
ncbi:MAG: DNA mismatch repair endonuclease MutL [Desulfohalobiaceae bacterium]|nr:DNA mismatch repair endonuclease MutL [Desulfohalobiaceae bacterium]